MRLRDAIRDTGITPEKMEDMHSFLTDLGFAEPDVCSWLSQDMSICNINKNQLANTITFLRFQGVSMKHIRPKHFFMNYRDIDDFLDERLWKKYFDMWVDGYDTDDTRLFKLRMLTNYENGRLNQSDYAILFNHGFKFDKFNEWKSFFEMYKNDPLDPRVQKWIWKQQVNASLRCLSMKRLVLLRSVSFPFQDHKHYQYFSFWDYSHTELPSYTRKRSLVKKVFRPLSPVCES